MKIKFDFQLNRRFGVVERIVFRLVLNGFANAREIRIALPLFSDAVVANAVRHLVNDQVLSADVETGTLSLSDAVVALIDISHNQSCEIDIPALFEDDIMQNGIEVFDNGTSEVASLKEAILRDLLPDVKLDFYRHTLDFIILPRGGEMSE